MKTRYPLLTALGALAALAASLTSFGCSHGLETSEHPILETIAESDSVAQGWTYAFQPDGLPASIADRTGLRTLTQAGNTLTYGDTAYEFDALGRTVRRDGTTFTYGADGQLASVTKGADAVTYVYDENGDRILRRGNGGEVTAYIDGDVVTDTDLIEPVTLAGKLVGVVHNGAFALVAADARGTALATTTGATMLPSPFGDRAAHPDVAQAIDYAQKSFDADIGAVRMGVSDYDPAIARFLTPDPLFLAHPEKCVESPVECNLYGYARNRPADLVDPSGNETEDWAALLPRVFGDDEGGYTVFHPGHSQEQIQAALGELHEASTQANAGASAQYARAEMIRGQQFRYNQGASSDVAGVNVRHDCSGTSSYILFGDRGKLSSGDFYNGGRGLPGFHPTDHPVANGYAFFPKKTEDGNAHVTVFVSDPKGELRAWRASGQGAENFGWARSVDGAIKWHTEHEGQSVFYFAPNTSSSPSATSGAGGQ